MIHAKKPKTINGDDSASSAFSLNDTVGIRAKIKKAKKSGTINNVSHAIPSVTGPKGMIHNCPDHVTKKMVRKNKARLRKGLRENIAKRNVIINVDAKAAGITK